MADSPTFFERNSVLFKILVCALLAFLLMIPKSMIEDLVYERSNRQTEAVAEVTSKWGSASVLTGPILSIPYRIVTTEYVNTTDAAGVVRSKPIEKQLMAYYHVLPEVADFSTELLPDIRSRGIFDVVVYRQKTEISGTFRLPKIEVPNVKPEDILYSKAFLSMGLSDMKGIESAIEVDWNGKKQSFEPGLPTKDVIDTGVSAPVELANDSNERTFRISLALRGAQSVKFVPVGKTTNVSVASSWKSPSFDGAFLPYERNVDSKGFTAKWKVLHFNRDFPQHWASNAYALGSIPNTQTYNANQQWNQYGSYDMARKTEMSIAQAPAGTTAGYMGNYALGVNLITPVDTYDKTSRTIKYAFLIISLSFLSFFLMEVVRRRPIHVIQYLLIGFALCVFYTLLLSIGEHTSFNAAYLISSALTIGLITAYIWSVFANVRLSAFIGGILLILYGFVFVILQSEDYAMLIGSLGVFVILATVMLATRKIDWYNVSK